MYRSFFKQLMDITVAFIILVIASPIILIVIILLSIANRGEPFFLHARPGKDERIFKVIKFKTMNDKKDVHGELLPDAERLTGVGKFVRKTSIDELPQLINVLKGDMSLIGPRPLMIEYLPYYDQRQKKRHSIKPGITGWAQINGRNSISWSEKFELDVWYVEHLSFITDLKIFFLTIKNIFTASGISAEGHATMPKFSDEMERKMSNLI